VRDVACNTTYQCPNDESEENNVIIRELTRLLGVVCASQRTIAQRCFTLFC